jgi:uncharacterized protein YbjT (DUF2867 family)
MRIAIAGGHGQIALQLTELLAKDGDEVIGLVRNPDHEADVAARGGKAAVVDLEQAPPVVVAEAIAGADAVVFAAGAGPGSGAARKLTVDRDAAVTLIEACERAQVRRYVMVSSIGADAYDPDSDDVFQVYLRAKSEADAALRTSGLDWTVVRPGPLTDDEPTGHVHIAEDISRAAVPRADVAAVLAACLHEPRSIGQQFELASGDVPIPAAVAALGGQR